MTDWLLVIAGSGPVHQMEKEPLHYAFKRDTEGRLIPRADNAERLARAFVAQLTAAGHQIHAVQFTSGVGESLREEAPADGA
jgi:hypothetical protein